MEDMEGIERNHYQDVVEYYPLGKAGFHMRLNVGWIERPWDTIYHIHRIDYDSENQRCLVCVDDYSQRLHVEFYGPVEVGEPHYCTGEEYNPEATYFIQRITSRHRIVLRDVVSHFCAYDHKRGYIDLIFPCPTLSQSHESACEGFNAQKLQDLINRGFQEESAAGQKRCLWRLLHH